MKKTILLVLFAIGMSFSAHGQVTSSLGLLYAPDVDDLDLGALVATVGYRFSADNGFSFQPEIRGGIGVIDDDYVEAGFGRVDVEIDSLFGFAARAQYQADNGFYVFAQPTYQRVELDVDVPRAAGLFDDDDSSWEWGVEGGAGFQFNENFGMEASYGVIDEDAVINVALRTWF